MVSSTILRPLSLLTRFMQWSSAVIVMGITAYFLNKYSHGQHTIYQQVISTLSVAFFIPAFLSPFMPTKLSRFVLPIDIIFSYLWLTAFIFAAQDYNWRNCALNAPPGASCALKKANEAFMFLAFFFTLLAIGLEVMNLRATRTDTNGVHREKHPPPGRAPVDGPAV